MQSCISNFFKFIVNLVEIFAKSSSAIVAKLFGRKKSQNCVGCKYSVS